MRDFYEELWERLGDDLVLPDFERRRDFLLGGIGPGERVLDLGCGAGDFTAEIAHAGAHAVGVEVARAAIERARRRYPQLTFLLAPVDGPLPIEDNSFSVVWSSEVIEHVADTARWLSEIRRVLKPRGRLLLTTPSHGRLPIAVHGVERYSEPLGDHLHLYTRRSLTTTLQDLGFAQIEVRAVVGPPLLKRMLLAQATR